MESLLIRGATVVTDCEEMCADVLVMDGEIAAIGSVGAFLPFGGKTPGSFDTVIDGSGCFLLPGGVDVHTHLCLDTGQTVVCDDFFTGTVAAACGGTTTIVDHPGFGPALCSLGYQIAAYHEKAQGNAVIDYGFHAVVQHVDDAVLAELRTIAAEGVTSCKAYMTYAYKVGDADLFRLLRAGAEAGVTVCVHAENDGVITLLRDEAGSAGNLSPSYHPRTRPAGTEAEAVGRAIYLAHLAGDAPLYVVHLTNAHALSQVKAARAHGQKNLYAETCPQYLLLNSRVYTDDAEGLKYIMCPPLRAPSDNAALWEALKGDIDTVATDHCPFSFAAQKLLFATGGTGKEADIDFRRCPSGCPGVEERLALLWSEGVVKKRISVRRFVDLVSANPAKRFGLYPRKGVIAPGSDADLVLWDGAYRRTLTASSLKSRVDYTAYEGLEVTGFPRVVISRGEVIVKEGVFLGKRGRGRFLKRS